MAAQNSKAKKTAALQKLTQKALSRLGKTLATAKSDATRGRDAIYSALAGAYIWHYEGKSIPG